MTSHVSLNPNSISIGEELTIRFVGWDRPTKVEVRVFEVDEKSDIEPAGKAKLMVTFKGTVSQTKFTPSGDPEVVPSDPGAPTITITAGGKSAVVPLPDGGQENGIFELEMEVRGDTGKQILFRTGAPVRVRAFRHFMVKKVARPVVAFITGAFKQPGADHDFFRRAEEFWKQHADLVLHRPGISLEEILEFLDKHGSEYGPWGQINIVAHGGPHNIKIKLFKTSEDNLHASHMKVELDNPRVRLLSPASLDSDTEIVFRACNAGGDQGLLDLIKSKVFRDAKFVKVPKFLQVYESETERRGQRVLSIKPKEFFKEALTFDRPTKEQAHADIQTRLRAAFDELAGTATKPSLSPGLDPKADATKEIPTYAETDDWVQRIEKLKFAPVFEKDLTDKDGRPIDPVKYLRDGWGNLRGPDDVPLEKSSLTWYTKHDRWTITCSRSDDKENREKRAWLQVIRGKASPVFKVLAGGDEGLGSSSKDNFWVIAAEGVAPHHAGIRLKKGALDTAQVVALDSHEKTFVREAHGRKVEVRPDNPAMFSLPFDILMGEAEVQVRLARVFVLNYVGSRYFVRRYRDMCKWDATKPYAKRWLAIVDPSDDKLFGTSK